MTWSLNASVVDEYLLLLPFSFFGLVLKSSKWLRHCLWKSLLLSFSMLIFVKSILIELPRSCSFLSGLTVSDYFIDQILTLSIKTGCVMYRLIAMWESFSSSKLKLISSQPLPKGKKNIWRFRGSVPRNRNTVTDLTRYDYRATAFLSYGKHDDKKRNAKQLIPKSLDIYGVLRIIDNNFCDRSFSTTLRLIIVIIK